MPGLEAAVSAGLPHTCCVLQPRRRFTRIKKEKVKKYRKEGLSSIRKERLSENTEKYKDGEG